MSSLDHSRTVLPHHWYLPTLHTFSGLGSVSFTNDDSGDETGESLFLAFSTMRCSTKFRNFLLVTAGLFCSWVLASSLLTNCCCCFCFFSSSSCCCCFIINFFSLCSFLLCTKALTFCLRSTCYFFRDCSDFFFFLLPVKLFLGGLDTTSLSCTLFHEHCNDVIFLVGY